MAIREDRKDPDGGLPMGLLRTVRRIRSKDTFLKLVLVQVRPYSANRGQSDGSFLTLWRLLCFFCGRQGVHPE